MVYGCTITYLLIINWSRLKQCIKSSCKKYTWTEICTAVINHSMQNLILEGLQQKLQNSCSRCNKNSRHIESSSIFQPPKYLLLFVDRFRYISNNITKDRCPIPMDTTVRLGPLKFSLQANIDRHGPSIDSGHYTASINCCKKILLQRSQNYGDWNYW